MVGGWSTHTAWAVQHGEDRIHPRRGALLPHACPNCSVVVRKPWVEWVIGWVIGRVIGRTRMGRARMSHASAHQGLVDGDPAAVANPHGLADVLHHVGAGLKRDVA